MSKDKAAITLDGTLFHFGATERENSVTMAIEGEYIDGFILHVTKRLARNGLSGSGKEMGR
jgi:hypothetical protein